MKGVPFIAIEKALVLSQGFFYGVSLVDQWRSNLNAATLSASR
jgi:hypothetical protein